MVVVAGLGNPGLEYRATRHNVGFDTVERLATRESAIWSDAPTARLARVKLMGREALLVEPMMYMNRSGEVLAALLGEFRPDALVVAYDDLDLPVGRVRIRRRGGSGGHRGVASVIEWCGGEFTRVRVGIGRPEAPASAAEYVLSPFVADERIAVDEAIERAANAIGCVVERGVEAAMDRFNADPQWREDRAGSL